MVAMLDSKAEASAGPLGFARCRTSRQAFCNIMRKTQIAWVSAQEEEPLDGAAFDKIAISWGWCDGGMGAASSKAVGASEQATCLLHRP